MIKFDEMELPIYQVDAFTSRRFAGNPAAVCPLDEWLPPETMQAIAAENNLPETAFFVRETGGFGLRWFTPATEVDLCGHGTLGSAFVLFEVLYEPGEEIRFSTKSGELRVARKNGRLVLDFPARPPRRCESPVGLELALGTQPLEVWEARDLMAVLDSEKDVRALQPAMERLMELEHFAVIATAPGDDCDFVSRFFAPAGGVPEDPVTGSAHCTLIPYWAERLGKTELKARQVSVRGGELWCELRGDRVSIGGEAVLYLRGSILI